MRIAGDLFVQMQILNRTTTAVQRRRRSACLDWNFIVAHESW